MSPTSYQAAPPRNNWSQSSLADPCCQIRLTRSRGAPGADLGPPSHAGAGPKRIPESVRRRCATAAASLCCRLRPGLSAACFRYAVFGSTAWRFSPMRFRPAAVSAVVCSLVALLVAGQARAAADVHRFNLVFSGNPTQIVGGDFNDALDVYNKTRLDTARLREHGSDPVHVGVRPRDALLRAPELCDRGGDLADFVPPKRRSSCLPSRRASTCGPRCSRCRCTSARSTTCRPTTRATSRPAPTSAAA